ncbi:GMC family oxidoreductase N-terminal domain-containing protein [Neorhizobium galegae]|uniref:GMC family oxidoreductase n=1 Tax=Neorhizobium galegae TaxID=399 RepID=UPI002100AEC9|nr:GMC family oxidoreductase N-terminal domain-containing protein [Neorhizobium galegae]MCQ1574623.1 GMC family oxidoreductase N-terminal domain-containing protein [Neorhizobium galegae]
MSDSGNSTKHAYTSPPPFAETFDYIVIGAGSAGSACAARLALESDARVLLLEAGGGDDIPEIHTPNLWLNSHNTRATKFFTTMEQHKVDGRAHVWPRGHVLGGSSSINAMIYARGHRSDYDSWVEQGNPGWGYDDVLPLFKEIEDYEGGESRYRGIGGPLHISQPSPAMRHPGAVAFMQACSNLGFRENPDCNGERLEGQTWMNLTVKDSRRQSAAVAILKPAMTRENLVILTDAPVVSLILDGNYCKGVRYLHGDVLVSAFASSEVILSAGAIDSPRILMQSGIGPAEDLASIGISPKADLPVGKGLQDHPLGAGCNYQAKGPVPQSHYNYSEVYMWEKSQGDLPAPDMVALYVSIPFASSGFTLPPGEGYAILSGVPRPHSRGELKLVSSDPTVPPRIDPNYFGDERDWHSFRLATELCRDIGADRAYDEFRKEEVLPGGGKLTDAEWRQFLAKSVSTFFHPVSTCRMGVDETAVVDPQLRVYGVEGLRVADASIMPSITTTNTNAASILIGWKCARMILQDWR